MVIDFKITLNEWFRCYDSPSGVVVEEDKMGINPKTKAVTRGTKRTYHPNVKQAMVHTLRRMTIRGVEDGDGDKSIKELVKSFEEAEKKILEALA